jgi:hypothetical protein
MGMDLDTYGMERETRKIIKIDVLGLPAMKASTLIPFTLFSMNHMIQHIRTLHIDVQSPLHIFHQGQRVNIRFATMLTLAGAPTRDFRSFYI